MQSSIFKPPYFTCDVFSCSNYGKSIRNKNIRLSKSFVSVTARIRFFSPFKLLMFSTSIVYPKAWTQRCWVLESDWTKFVDYSPISKALSAILYINVLVLIGYFFYGNSWLSGTSSHKIIFMCVITDIIHKQLHTVFIRKC